MRLSPDYIKIEMASRGVYTYRSDIVVLPLSDKITNYYLAGVNHFHYLLNDGHIDDTLSINSETGYFDTGDGTNDISFLTQFRGQVRIKFTTPPTLSRLRFLRITPIS